MFGLALALLASIPETPPVPTGVNGSILGSAEDFRTDGPARICTPRFVIDLQQGEQAYLAYSGIHNMRIWMQTRQGLVELSEGDSWANPSRKRLVQRRPDSRVYEVGNDREFRYLIVAATEYSEGELVPLAWIDGDNLRGNRSDRRVFDRFLLRADQGDNCDAKYGYGWGALLEGEPIFMRRRMEGESPTEEAPPGTAVGAAVPVPAPLVGCWENFSTDGTREWLEIEAASVRGQFFGDPAFQTSRIWPAVEAGSEGLINIMIAVPAPGSNATVNHELWMDETNTLRVSNYWGEGEAEPDPEFSRCSAENPSSAR